MSNVTPATVLAAVAAAQANWTDWDWTMLFDGNDYCGRPADDDKEPGAQEARDYADEVESSANAASELAEDACDAISEGDYGLAVELLDEASGIEQEYGDDPSYGPALRAAKALAESWCRCECGEWTGERCNWSGPIDETVQVEYMPRQHRSSHTAAGNKGSYPANGAVIVRVEQSCADALLEDETEHEWSRIV